MANLRVSVNTLEASAQVASNALNQASVQARNLFTATRNIASSVTSGNPQNENKADYFAEADIANIFSNIIVAFRNLGNVMTAIEQIENAEGPIEKGTHRRFMGKIEGELNTLQSEINQLKGLESRR